MGVLETQGILHCRCSIDTAPQPAEGVVSCLSPAVPPTTATSMRKNGGQNLTFCSSFPAEKLVRVESSRTGIRGLGHSGKGLVHGRETHGAEGHSAPFETASETGTSTTSASRVGRNLHRQHFTFLYLK